jgi:hypothetical protein
MATWNDQIPEWQSWILQMIYDSVACHVGFNQQSFVGNATPMANPHRADLDDLTESVGQTGVQDKGRNDTRVDNQLDIQVNAQLNDQVNEQVNDQVDNQVEDMAPP